MLERFDIAGQKVVDMVVTIGVVIDGIEVCRGILRLESGVNFELQSQDPLLMLPILAIAAADIPQGRRIDELCGRQISEVVTSLYWPSLGVIVDGDWLVYMNSAAPAKISVTATRIGEKYGPSDYRPYFA